MPSIGMSVSEFGLTLPRLLASPWASSLKWTSMSFAKSSISSAMSSRSPLESPRTNVLSHSSLRFTNELRFLAKRPATQSVTAELSISLTCSVVSFVKCMASYKSSEAELWILTSVKLRARLSAMHFRVRIES